MSKKDDSGVSKSEWNMTSRRIEYISDLVEVISRYQFALNSGDTSVIRDYYSALKTLYFNLCTLMEKKESVKEKKDDLNEIDEDISAKLENNPQVMGGEIKEIKNKLEELDIDLRWMMKEANLDFKQKEKIEPGKEILEGIFE